jgi:hypothetical protein
MDQDNPLIKYGAMIVSTAALIGASLAKPSRLSKHDPMIPVAILMLIVSATLVYFAYTY